MTQAKEFTVASKFYLQIDGVVDKVPVKSFSGMKADTQATPLIMGNAAQGKPVFQKAPTVTSGGGEVSLTVYVQEGEMQLYNWFKQCVPPEGGASQWKSQRKTGSLFSLNQQNNIAAQWDLTGVFPTNYQPGDFDASSADVSTEQVTLAYETFKRVK